VVIIGGGKWTSENYVSRTTAKAASGTPIFAHSATVHSTGIWDIHPSLDPKSVNNDGAHKGANIRESLDSDEHPASQAIGVLFDVTGSMRTVPQVLQEKLPKLYSMLLEKGYIEHPQILYGAIGDAYGDRVPLQVGQFESDNRADEALENIILEGGGGGGNHESYNLGAYFMARHTYIDCFEKRGKKGYLFLIGDERLYAMITKKEVEQYIGGGLQDDLSTEELFEELKKKWEVFFLFAVQGSYGLGEDVLPDTAGSAASGGWPASLGWRKILGQNAIVLEDADAVCETIALTLGMMEGNIDLDAGLADLDELGTGEDTKEKVGKALATVGATATTVASVEGDLPENEEGGAERI
jgi:hypothetical protein